jgi:hypothetical protein
MSVFVWGIYDDTQRADRAVGDLVEGSFPPEEIRVNLRDARGEREVPVRHRTRAALGAGIGAVFGALAFAIGVDATPSIAFGGAAVGAMTGAYGGLLWWSQKADLSEGRDVRSVVVGIIAPDGRANEASAILRGAGAAEVGLSRKSPARE